MLFFFSKIKYNTLLRGVVMDEDIIVDEYLNHFYTYDELAEYLNVSIERVSYVLDTVGGKVGLLVKKHKSIIEAYDENDESLKVETELDSKIVDIANYIIATNSSVRETAKKYSLSKTTIGKYVNDKLPKISIKLYKKVFDVMQEHKSLSVKYKSHRDILDEELKCLDDNLTIEEIAESLNLSRNQVQRDLANRSKMLSKDLNKKIKKKLFNNQMIMNRK